MSSNFTVERVCEQCGNIFTARTTVTRFCSKPCNSKNHKQKLRSAKIAAATQQVKSAVNHRLDELHNLEFLDVKTAAKLLGASDKILYTMIRSGRLKATNLSIRKTVISRSDIDRLFELPDVPDERKPNSSNLSECCHMGEAQKIYNISEKALFDILKRNDVPKYQVGKFSYVLRVHLDQIFKTGDCHA
ncbi:MAG TPA: helix-turn-helix domain-containing protein [Mucilaginibacter sp.]|nr:helix-turn-helix domain-containing protein [Mucilaginibacter sp.]